MRPDPLPQGAAVTPPSGGAALAWPGMPGMPGGAHVATGAEYRWPIPAGMEPGACNHLDENK